MTFAWSITHNSLESEKFGFKIALPFTTCGIKIEDLLVTKFPSMASCKFVHTNGDLHDNTAGYICWHSIKLRVNSVPGIPGTCYMGSHIVDSNEET